MSDRQRASEFVDKQDLTNEEVRQICNYMDGKDKTLIFRPSIRENMLNGVTLERAASSDRPDEVKFPDVGDYVSIIVGMPGPDSEYGICVQRTGDKALVRALIPGGSEFYEIWGFVDKSHLKIGDLAGFIGACSIAKYMDRVTDKLRDERARLFPELGR